MDDPKLTKQNLLELIEFEIKRIEAYQNRAGWNTWLLMGTLIATLGRLLSILNNNLDNKFDWEIIIFLFISWALGYEWIKSVITQLSKQKVQEIRIFKAEEILSPHRLGFFYTTVYSAIMVYLSIQQRNIFPLYYAVAILYAVYGMIGILLLIFSYKATPYAQGINGSRINLISVAFFTFIPIELFLAGKEISSSLSPIATNEIQLSFLIASVHAILIILTERKVQTNRIEKLENIYRLARLEDSNPSSDENKLKMLLFGLSPLEFFCDEIKKMKHLANKKEFGKIFIPLVKRIDFVKKVTKISPDFESQALDLLSEFRDYLNNIKDTTEDTSNLFLLTQLNTMLTKTIPEN